MKWHRDFAGSYSAQDDAGTHWQVIHYYVHGAPDEWRIYKNGSTTHTYARTLRQCKRWIEGNVK